MIRSEGCKFQLKRCSEIQQFPSCFIVTFVLKRKAFEGVQFGQILIALLCIYLCFSNSTFRLPTEEGSD